MILLAFWSVGNFDVERHTLDNVSDVDAFDILWHKRDELDARFYDFGSFSYSDPNGQYGILNAYDFEEDFNDEILDNGRWGKTIRIDEEDLRKIINE